MRSTSLCSTVCARTAFCYCTFCVSTSGAESPMTCSMNCSDSIGSHCRSALKNLQEYIDDRKLKTKKSNKSKKVENREKREKKDVGDPTPLQFSTWQFGTKFSEIVRKKNASEIPWKMRSLCGKFRRSWSLWKPVKSEKPRPMKIFE